MRNTLIIIVAVLLIGCGSRRVDKHSSSTSENVSSTEISNTQVEALQITRDKISSLTYDIEIRGDAMTTDAQGNTNITNPVITGKGTLSNQDKVDSTKTKFDSNTYQGIDSNKKGDSQGKKVDKKQFNWWLAMPPILVIIAITWIYIYIKKRKSNGTRN